MKSNAEIRAAARAQLGGNIFSEPWLMGLVLGLILWLVAGVGNVIALLLYGPLWVAVCAIFLRLARGDVNKIDLGALGYGFGGDTFVRFFLLYILQTAYLLLWAMLFYIPMIVKTYSYRLAPYIAVERPELSVNDCITESRRLMDGHKMQAFCLDLSFLGWYILGIFACCVGVFFVIPYHQAAIANFYTALVEKDEPIEAIAEDVPTEEK